MTTRSPEWAVVCDFDGTIACTDVTDGILSRFALPEWESIETEWLAGKIGSRECMERQIALVRATREELDAFLDTVEIDPDFAAFVDDCHAYGLPLRVVSDGLDYGIQRILCRAQLDYLPVTANRLVERRPGQYQLEFPHFQPGCRAASGTCKCALACGHAPRRTLLIGDGCSDFCLAAEASHVFAKDKLLAHCQHRRLAHSAFTDFKDVRKLLARLIGHEQQAIKQDDNLEQVING